MIRRITLLLMTELTKAVRLRSSYGGIVVVLLGVFGALLLQPIRRDVVSDYAFIVSATTGALNLLGLLVVVLFSVTQTSSELTHGTVRLILVRPMLRSDFVFAKLLLGMLYVVLLLLATSALTWGLTLLWGDLYGVSYGGELGYTASDMRRTYLAGMGLSLLPFFTAVAYGVCIALLTRTLASAMGTALLLWLLVDMVKHRLGIAPFIFSSYVETPWQPFKDMTQLIEPHWNPGAWHCAAVCGVWFCLFTALALFAMHRRDLRL